jgi:hypothetical protein
MTWLDAPGAAEWLPILRAAEKLNDIPTNLLCRQCYEESKFNPHAKSPAGAVGIMQLEPRYFPGAGNNPIVDISTAAAYMRQLHHEFDDWQLALAAYNWGPGAVRSWVEKGRDPNAMPVETRNYVSQIVADVPVAGSLCPGGTDVNQTQWQKSSPIIASAGTGTMLATLIIAALSYYGGLVMSPDVKSAITGLCIAIVSHFFHNGPNG